MTLSMDKDDVLETIENIEQSIKLFERQIKLYLDCNPYYPDGNTVMIKKLQRANVDYLKLLALINEKIETEE